ncbi:MAG: hypothetical protein JXA10_05945 [Anaerolineae bacterium]|nr:hypothetical protein [Anaerolineae bacterium]
MLAHQGQKLIYEFYLTSGNLHYHSAQIDHTLTVSHKALEVFEQQPDIPGEEQAV